MAKKIKIKIKKPQGLKAFDIALQYYQSGNVQQAEIMCRQLLDKQPNHADAWHLMGHLKHCEGQYDNAIDYFSKAIKINPLVYSWHCSLGLSFALKGNMSNAITAFKKSLELKPTFLDALNNLGLALTEAGKPDEAIEYFKKALVIYPDFVEAYNNLGLAFEDKGLLDEAMENYKKALGLKPDNAESWLNYGNILKSKGMVDEAIENYKKALDLKPDLFDAYKSMGVALREKDLVDDAIQNYRKAVTLRPDFADAYSNLGLLYAAKGMADEAIGNHKKALLLKPYNAEVHCNSALSYLLAKDFNRGWEEYEWRLKNIKVAELTRPKWDGSPLKGKTILVYAEQGYGDSLQFARYLPKLYDEFEAKKVLYMPLKGLEQLLRDSDLKAEILTAETLVESLEYDTNIHLLSLPRIFKTNLENIPFRQKRYLKANPEKVAWYREKFFNPTRYTLHATRFKIGIFWQGNPGLKPDKNRSMPLHHIYSICRLPNVKIYSLQKGHGMEQLNDIPEDIKVTNIGETFNDFSDTAAAIENLDLVITVDTAICHLSGALGKKTWILLPSHAEWRWHLDMDYSPWYEDVKLFRHKEMGKKDWDEMMERVVQELKKADSG